jgi:hypothetical protein
MLSASALRDQLNRRALARSTALGQLCEVAPGSSVLFGPCGGAHGNFFPPSYQAICSHSEWARRLSKAHSAHRRARSRSNWSWRELDCAASSDALLMNIFCAPGVLARKQVAALLGISPGAAATFGFKPRTPLRSGLTDRTEIDLALGAPALFVEAKLTETGFQTARPALAERFLHLHDVFHEPDLPRTVAIPTGRYAWSAAEERLLEQTRGTPGLFQHYQLIRGVLAAHAHGARFCLLADARRPDLQESWLQILHAVRLASLRPRLQMLTWQELAGALDAPLQAFLDDKYGIVAA